MHSQIDITTVPENDTDVWRMIGEGRVKGCFQIESHLGKTWCQKLKPENMTELAALISIIRPGTLKAIVDGKSMTQHFVDRKHKQEEIPSLGQEKKIVLFLIRKKWKKCEGGRSFFSFSFC